MQHHIKTDDSGWIRILKSDNKTSHALCAYTKASVIRNKEGRTFFRVCDGPDKDMIASLKDENAAIYLSNHPRDASIEAEAVLTVTYKKLVKNWYSKARGELLDQQMASVTFDGKTLEATLNSVWGTGFTPIPIGEYKIRVPDYPHDAAMTNFYRGVAPKLRYDQVWFPIEYGDNSRYVHVGNLSDGCVTVLDLEKWNEVHAYLIKHRAPGGKHVGKLVVKAK